MKQPCRCRKKCGGRALLLLLWGLVAVHVANALSTSSQTKASVRAASQGPDNLHDPSSQYSIIPWVIVGGGIHGVHIASRLIRESRQQPADILIVDPHESLLQQWKHRTTATGMHYLRSSAPFHLDLEDNSLRKFGDKTFFTRDYERPQLTLFNSHCDRVVEDCHLSQRHLRDAVTDIEPGESFIKVSLADRKDPILASQIVLAVGNDQPVFPDWVKPQHADFVEHIMEITDDRLTHDLCGKTVAIVGGGLTAAHKALELIASFKDVRVLLISRHNMKEQQFDTHPDYMMDEAACIRSRENGGIGAPKRLQRFQELTTYQERRNTIRRERIPGTVTAAVNRGKGGLQYAIEEKRIEFRKADVESLRTEGQQHYLELSTTETIPIDKVFLATGFGMKPPGGLLFEGMKASLPTSDYCGYPLLDYNLRWGESNIFCTGGLAELELGPSARNIAGARLAAERILKAAVHAR